MTHFERASDAAVRVGLAALTLTAVGILIAFPDPNPGYTHPPIRPLKTIGSVDGSSRGDNKPIDYGTLTGLYELYRSDPSRIDAVLGADVSLGK